MPTNLLPSFSSSEWENEGVTITSSSDYDVTFTTSEWTGLVYTIPSSWHGQNIVIGCSSISGGMIAIQTSNYDDVFDPIETAGEYTYTIPTNAALFYIVSETTGQTMSVTGIYAYMEGDTGGGGNGGDTVSITLRPTNASGSNWTDTRNVYDGLNSTAATVSANSTNYSSRVLTCNFNTSTIPNNATITSATLNVVYKQSSSTSTRRYTPYIDINGSSNNRVINKELTDTSTVTNTANILTYMPTLSTITVTPNRAGSSGSNTLTLYEIYIDIKYELPSGPIDLTNLTLDKSALDMNTNTSATLNCIITPDNADTYEMAWSKDNDNVEITPNDLSCMVKAVKKGTSMVTVTDNTTGLSARCIISIVKPENQTQNACLGGVKFSNMYVGEIPIIKMYLGDILIFYNLNTGNNYGFTIGYQPITNEDTTLASNAVIVTTTTQLTSALNSIKAGQTIYLRTGTYNIGEYWLDTTGTESSPIVIRNYPNEKPILKGSSIKMNADLNYITISGLTITDLNILGNDVWDNAISIGPGNSYIIIENNEFYNLTSEGGVNIESGLQAIYASGDMNESNNPIRNCTIRNNYIHDCATGWSEAVMLEGNVTDCEIYNNTVDNTGNIGLDVAGNYDWLGTVGDSNNQARNIVIRNNLVMNGVSEYATAAGIYGDGARNITVEHNIIYHCQCGIEMGAEEPGATVENFHVRNNLVIDCGRAIGVGGYQSTSATHRNTYLYNNTIIGGDWYEDDNAMVAIYRTTNFKAYNNIFYAQSGNSLIENESGTIDFNYNCWYQQGLSSKPSGEGVNSFVANPLFTNYTNTMSGDYTLQSSSPCVGGGVYDATYCGELDIRGKKRVNGVIDIGCYEY